MPKEENTVGSLTPRPEVSKIVLSCLVAGLFVAVIGGIVYFGNNQEETNTASKVTLTVDQSNFPESLSEPKTASTRRNISSGSTSTAVTTTLKQSTTSTTLVLTTQAPTTAKSTTVATTATTVLSTPTSPESVAGGPSAEAWSKLRDCEASGNYQISSRNGLYHGAYQFDQSTWDGTAKNAGRVDLVGELPAKVDPKDQDAMALVLYESRGAAPWPTCGRHLK